MSYLGVETTNYQAERRDWLLSPHGTDPGTTLNVTLDVSTFTAATHYPNGYIPSGVVLGVITAASSGASLVVGPYDDTATDGRQTALGILFGYEKVPNLADTTKDTAGAVLVHGFIRKDRLPIAAASAGGGFLDANGVTDLKLIHAI